MSLHRYAGTQLSCRWSEVCGALRGAQRYV